MKQTVWTMILVAILAFFGAYYLVELAGYAPSSGTAATVLGIYLVVTLGVVAWMQTRWGALLVVGVGLLIFAAQLVFAALYLHPQYGDQMGQVLYALLTLIIPLFGFLSYRSIEE